MWRQTNVIPSYTGKRPKSCASSYRPVFLTDVACKLLECLILDQIRYFWVANKLLFNEQHDFLPGRSMVTNLVTADSIIADYLNKCHPVDVIFLDFARAFGKVRHNILISKLSSLGISAPLDWITDFLCKRTWKVIYSDSVSAPISVTSGIIQSSGLGPLLFWASSATYLNKLRIVTSFYLLMTLKQLMLLLTAMSKTLSSRISIQSGTSRRRTIYRFPSTSVYVYITSCITRNVHIA